MSNHQKAARTRKAGVPVTKIGTLIHLIKRPRGATLAELQEATGWQAHSVRGAISGTLKKKLGLAISIGEGKKRGRYYHLPRPGKSGASQ